MPRPLCWLPVLDNRPGPKYLRIADALAEDVQSGRLQPSARLPTHRELAWALGITVGTVSRAYAEAERRGLVVGEVGRGSYVRAGGRSPATMDMPELGGDNLIEMGINRPPAHLAADAFAAALLDLSRSNELSELINYSAHTGQWRHRVAGAAWIARDGFDVSPEQVLVTSGAQHAIAASLMAFTVPGDTVLVEALTWSGLRAAAALLHLNLRAVEMDDEGIVPDALAAAQRATGARLLYTMPTVHNPTTAVQSEDRRRAIAALARQADLTIIEDDVHGFLQADAPPPLAAFARERTIFVTGASKSVSPALRVGFTALPDNRLGRFSAAARANNWMAPPLMGEIMARWIRDGTAAELAERIRADSAQRQSVAREMLSGQCYRATDSSFHIWLCLPDRWRPGEFIEAMRERGVSVTPPDLFVPGRAEAPRWVRVALSATRTFDELRRGLSIVRDLLNRDPVPVLAVA